MHVAAGAAIVILLSAGACTSDDGEPEAQPTTTAPTTTAPTTTLSPEEQDEADLRRLSEEWFEVVASIYRDGAEPSLAEDYLTGDYLAEFVEDAEGFQQVGSSIHASADTDHDIIAVDLTGDSATVTECVIDADVLIGPDGEVENDAIAAYTFETAASRTQHGWRFVDRTTIAHEEGAQRCEL